MNKGGKAKNPCKVCCRTVSNKTGVQCKGVCKKWAHFKCLNYTPGKIQDIKAGRLRITCPCPDCNTSEPREVKADPYTCTNFQCPANSLPNCESADCPSMYHITKMPVMPEPSPSSISATLRCTAKRREHAPIPNQPLSWATESSSFIDANCPKPCMPLPRCPPPKPRCPPPLRPVCSNTQNKMCSPIRSLSCSFVGKDSCHRDLRRCPKSDCKNTDARRCVKNDCKNIDPRRCVKNDCKNIDRCPSKNACTSDSLLVRPKCPKQKSLYCTMEQMCTTVGQLSGQLKELMCRMMEAFEKPCS